MLHTVFLYWLYITHLLLNNMLATFHMLLIQSHELNWKKGEWVGIVLCSQKWQTVPNQSQLATLYGYSFYIQ